MKYIYGLNTSGKSIIKFFIKNHFQFCAWDDDEKKRKEVKKKFKNIFLISPQNLDWSNINEAFISPGIDLKTKSLNFSKKNKTNLLRDLELYSQIIEKDKIIAVTGTNGKSTTVKLISEILKSNKIDNYIGGNFGPPLMNVFNKKKNFKYHVLELSSFQLEAAPSFKSYISILLNISKDHQDRYKNMSEYVNAKEKIIKSKKIKYRVISIDDFYCRKIYKKNKKLNNIIPFSFNKRVSKGFSFINNIIYDDYFDNDSYNLDKKSLSLKGNYNNQNILAAYIVSKILKLDSINFSKCINRYRGLAHRLEFVYENEKYLFINNSKATNVESSINSIKIYENIFLILGGKVKDNNFFKFNNVKRRISKCFIIGESTELIFNKVSKYFICHKSYTIKKAIDKIFTETKKNKTKITVLLAPACASFDQYDNFADRGNDFKKIIINKINKK